MRAALERLRLIGRARSQRSGCRPPPGRAQRKRSCVSGSDRLAYQELRARRSRRTDGTVSRNASSEGDCPDTFGQGTPSRPAQRRLLVGDPSGAWMIVMTRWAGSDSDSSTQRPKPKPAATPPTMATARRASDRRCICNEVRRDIGRLGCRLPVEARHVRRTDRRRYLLWRRCLRGIGDIGNGGYDGFAVRLANRSKNLGGISFSTVPMTPMP